MNPGSTVVCVLRVHAFKMIYIEDTWSPKCVSRVHAFKMIYFEDI